MKNKLNFVGNGHTNYSDDQDNIISTALAIAIIVLCGIIGIWSTL